MPRLLAAPDKFRDTAAAAEVAAAAARGALSAGWGASELPLADGGEGTLDVLSRALGGERRRAVARGPLGEPVEADWLLVPDGLSDLVPDGLSVPGGLSDLVPDGLSDHLHPRLSEGLVCGPVAVIESARAAGRALLRAPEGDEPVRAGSQGVGDLILAAVGAGARLVIVGAGGTATTDGGWGALSVVGTRARLRGARLVVACDVATPFRAAAETFGPQKGATPAQVAALRTRLERLADRYRVEYGVDVDRLVGAGAAGGLAGGLAALGARLVGGFQFVAALVDLDHRAAAADLVMTGEGRLDATSFEGKVVGGVLGAAGGTPRVLCIAGEVEPGVERYWATRPGQVDVVSLVAVVGEARARLAATEAVSDVVALACRAGRGTDGR